MIKVEMLKGIPLFQRMCSAAERQHTAHGAASAVTRAVSASTLLRVEETYVRGEQIRLAL